MGDCCADDPEWTFDVPVSRGTGVPQEGQNREPGARSVPQSEHDGGWVTRAPHASQNAVFVATGFLHRGQNVCFFFFTPGILLPPQM